MASLTNQFYLKLRPSTAYNFIIHWGDDSVETYNKTSPSTEGLAMLLHTYATSGVYVVRIDEAVSGGFPSIYNNGTTFTGTPSDDVKIVSVNSWGNIKWGPTFAEAFEGCTNLSAIPATDSNSNFGSTTDFTYAWFNCTSLSFVNLTLLSATNLSNAWTNNTNLKSFNLNAPNATNFSSTWQNCTSLTNFNDTNLYAPKANDFASAWLNCTSLSSVNLTLLSATNCNSAWYFNTNLKSFNLTAVGGATNDFNQAWQSCTSLKDFNDSNLYAPKANNFNQAWANCTSLSSVNLTLLSATNCNSAWYDDTNLKNFNLNAPNATNFSSAWRNCYSLSASDFPTLNMSKMTNGANCFNGVKLQTQSYSALLTSLCATNFNSNVQFHGGNSKRNSAGTTAYVHLTAVRNWSITDGGPE